MANPINFHTIEKKWQSTWESKKAFQSKQSKKQKHYVLEMYPYPSASGLHMGHAFNYTIGDIQARFKRMQGYNVLYPMGYDSFGLPAENAAIKAKSHPKKFTEAAIKNFIKQQKALGLTYDWTRLLYSHDPNYYKWNQYFFLQFYKNKLAYRKKALVNFCEDCNTVLANEQVQNGKCWRHQNTKVHIKPLEQWFLKTTKYADELLSESKNLNWPERIKTMQENWIGKSHGTEINFEINGKNWPIFTTRPDTIYGVTFMVISSHHPKLNELISEKQKNEVQAFLRKIKTTSQEGQLELEKDGVFTGSYALNPLTKEEIPIYAGTFVVADYGSGMVMAVPAHDQRDFEFAKKHNLPIKTVIQPSEEETSDLLNAYVDEGNLINSGDFTGLNNKKAIHIITEHLEKNNLGKKVIQFKLRDWLISRQRYWGTPIPIIYCDKCGIVPVPEKDLPVKLPEKVKFGQGNPLATANNFVNVKCPTCKSPAKRETDTMDTFFDSSWYYLRFTDSQNKKAPFDKKNIDYWMPVDFYTGGAEHACLHLIYARFFTKALRDLGFLKFNEPFTQLFNQGMLHKDGFVMSKSRGNIVLPEEVSKKYGIDTARLFLMSIASPDKDTEWNEKGIEGSWKLMNRIFNFYTKCKPSKSSTKIQHKINKSIIEITEDIENIRYNLAIIKLRSLFETIEKEPISKKDLESFLKLLSPFCPHIAEELFSKNNKSLISLSKWPIPDISKIDEKIEQKDQALDKTLSDINNILKLIKEKPKTIYLYVIPNELSNYNSASLSEKLSLEVKVFSVSDKNKIDPQNKSKKAKPGKPGIYVE
jgi:leucyl-tRNA synthetase